MQSEDGVFTVSGPMCAWGLELSHRRQGQGLVYKNTKWVTNSPFLAEVLDTQCRNRRGGPIHRHVSLVGGLASLAAKYPDELVLGVLEGLKQQMKYDKEINSLELFASGPNPSEDLFPVEFQNEVAEFYDDISGEALPPELVRKARQEEVAWIHKIGLYKKVPRQEAREHGLGVLPIRWVDVNKGDRHKYNCRSRIVGKELKAKTKEALLAHDLFSATPPWEMIKGLLSMLVTDPSDEMQKLGKDKQELVLGVFDISRAHFMPPASRRLYVEIPSEDKIEGEGDVIGLLLRGMYGCRDASNNWMKHWQELLREGGYEVGVSNPALFYNPELNARGAVHGDDFYVLGPIGAVDGMKDLLGSKYQMRESHRLGFAEGCKREATVLNRIVVLGESEGRRYVQIHPDKRHVELIVQSVGMKMDGSNGLQHRLSNRPISNHMPCKPQQNLGREKPLFIVRQ